jgi:glycosyltransferase involved in cell wall biosynthesis
LTLISVVIPAFNEADRIGDCLRETALALQGLDYEIIPVDDGSRDATFREMAACAAQNPRVRPVRQPSNQGKGAAVFLGCQHATGDLIAFLDADLELHPSQLLSFIHVMRQTKASVVIGCKSHPDSQLTYPRFRQATSVVYSALVQFLFGLDLHDTQTGIKLFRAETLRCIIPRLRARRFAFDLELLVAASRYGYKIAQSPVVVSFQREHGGRINLLAIARMFLDTLQIFYQASFWKWLEPGLRVRFWMVTLAVGLVVAAFGVAHLLMLWIPVPQLSRLVYVLALRFIDARVRDAGLIVIGALLAGWALIELNKSLLAAFAHADKGDLASIMRRSPQDAEDHHRGPDEQAPLV